MPPSPSITPGHLAYDGWVYAVGREDNVVQITLKEKQIASYWVFPVLEQVEGQQRVTLIILVGDISHEPEFPISGEEVWADLLDAAGNKLKMVQSPQVGPLPVRGGPSLQSTARFIFQLSGMRPKHLKVTLKQATETFSIDDVRQTKDTFNHQPDSGGDYPVRDPPTNILEKILRAILDFLKGIGRFFKNIFDSDKCCLRPPGLQAPANVVPGLKREHFEMNADFDSRGKDCSCACCEYRQFVRGAFRDAAGDPVPFQLPDGPFDATEYREDGIPNAWGPGEHDYYGHREQQRHVNDDYSLPGRKEGCRYRGNDTPQCAATETLHAEFIGLIVDTCQAKIVEVRSWVVNL